MASALKNLDIQKALPLRDYSEYTVGIVVSEWNSEITDALFKGAYDSLLKSGVKEENIVISTVPGSYELCFGAAAMSSQPLIQAVICLGCVIQGETRHFDFICSAVANGLIDVSLKYAKPVIFGVLTTDTLEQAQDRAGGKHGNKGTEAAITALKMSDHYIHKA
ncbi:MAG: 6,7-dimethyl-8-ribityllumazine synthase [Bacteroidota bacterium]